MNTIQHGDCIREMNRLEAGSVDLVFADPPFNIGYSYDVYRDSLTDQRYLKWSREWIGAVHRILKSNGAFWLAIGDEYAAELKIEAQKLGFHCRSWVIWYYTFGVNCTHKFTRSHAHLFHFVKDPENFTFRADEPENRIPSARQLVYNDTRANPRGRLPDDTWIIRPADAVGELTADEPVNLGVESPRDDDRTWTLRPQDVQNCFRPEEDTWYFPRVAGTFKERAGFHGCQMPEQLLGRIIRCCTEPGAVVLDPFSGSGTTTAVAKKLGRKFLAFDLSEDYVRLGRKRLEAIRVGDLLDGSAEPLVSAPSTAGRRGKGRSRSSGSQKATSAGDGNASTASNRQLELTIAGVVEAFAATHRGFSADRVVVDPELNAAFTTACRDMGLVGEPRSWNMLLFRLRKAGQLAAISTTERTLPDDADRDEFQFASEIAWQKLLEDERASSLDEILCDPDIAAEFDAIAQQFAPGFNSLVYRWAALKLRKQSHAARRRAAALSPPTRFGKPLQLEEFDPRMVPSGTGVYLLGGRSRKLYVGEAVDLQKRLSRQFARNRCELWREHADLYGIAPDKLSLWIRPVTARAGEMLAWQACLVQRYKPCLNVRSAD